MSEEEGMVALDVVFVGLEAQGVEVRLLTRPADLHGSVERFGPNLQCSAGKKNHEAVVSSSNCIIYHRQLWNLKGSFTG